MSRVGQVKGGPRFSESLCVGGCLLLLLKPGLASTLCGKGEEGQPGPQGEVTAAPGVPGLSSAWGAPPLVRPPAQRWRPRRAPGQRASSKLKTCEPNTRCGPAHLPGGGGRVPSCGELRTRFSDPLHPLPRGERNQPFIPQANNGGLSHRPLPLLTLFAPWLPSRLSLLQGLYDIFKIRIIKFNCHYKVDTANHLKMFSGIASFTWNNYFLQKEMGFKTI